MGGLQASNAESDIDPSQIRLQELGYKQEFRRSLAPLESGVLGACTMNPFITVLPFMFYGLSYGGPVVIVWSWWIVVAFNICIGLALSEICSSFPTVGSLYFWSSSMAPIKYKPIVAWYTAWFELVALVISCSGLAYPTTQLIAAIILLWTGGYNSTGTNADAGYSTPKWLFFLIFCTILITWGLLNSLPAKAMAFFNLNYFWFNLFFCIVFVVTLSFVVPESQSASFVFTEWHVESYTGVTSDFANVVFGTLLAQFCFFGYDVGAHISEETRDADRAGPASIMGAIIIEALFGYALILAVLFAIQDPIGDVLNPDNIAHGNVMAFIIYRAFHARYGNAYGAYVFLILMIYPFYSSGASCVMSSARAVFAVSRDGVMPFSNVWRKLNPVTKVPVNAVWLACFVGILMGAPTFKSDSVYFACSSVTTIAWVGSYIPPMVFRVLLPDKDFKPGRFSLGKWAKPCCVVGTIYAAYTMIVFMIPLVYPITELNFNYGPVTFGGLLLLVTIWWVVDARYWFEGPHRTIDDASLTMQNQWGAGMESDSGVKVGVTDGVTK